MTEKVTYGDTLSEPTSAALAELDRQVRTLHALGYPELAGLDPAAFDALVAPLRERLPAVGTADDHFPFLLVVSSAVVPTVDAVRRWEVGGKHGWTDMVDELGGFRPIEGVEVPQQPVYLLLDVATGQESLNVRPVDALQHIEKAGRTPLTIDEGVALVTHRPELFTTHNAFQALGSRAANRRVPSFWMSKGAPRLGWCWAGNPHTWLGAASAAARRA